MAVSTPSDPRAVVIHLLKASDAPPSLRELAASAQQGQGPVLWRDLRRAVWAMMEDGTLVFTPDWTIAFGKPKTKAKSGGAHGRARARRPVTHRTA